jgi:peroxiredoxin
LINISHPVSDFELPALDGRLYRLSDQRGRIVVVNFWSCECPQSERTDKAILPALVQWQDVVLLTVASNRNESVGAIKAAAETRQLPAVLLDENCRVADQLEAQTTPHVFVVDHMGILRYRSAVDNLTFRRRLPTRFFLAEAVESLLKGQLPATAESPAFGCAIVREI